MSAPALRQEEWRQILTQLLPRGRAWRTDDASVLGRLMGALARPFAALHARILVLLDVEADPAQTVELLADWEAEFGLPDDCCPQGATLAQRRTALLARIADPGGQSRARMIAVAKSLGYDITITEFEPLCAGFSAGALAYGDDWCFAWQVNAPSHSVRYWSAGDGAGELLTIWDSTTLECVLNRIKPSHSVLIFSYGA